MGRAARPGEILVLSGDLGVGKTIFTKGFAEGLGVTEPVTSPTFTIVREYDEGRIPFYHFDVYRISDPDEMYAIGFDEYVDSDGVCLLEWGELIRDILPKGSSRILIEKDPEKGFDYRKITIEEDYV